MGKIPSTPALRLLRSAKAEFEVHSYAYEPRGGTRVSSRELGVDEHCVIKTLLFEAANPGAKMRPAVVLMHGDLKVSQKELARVLGAKTAKPCEPKQAERHAGYRVGGTSPFGLRKPIPVLAEQTIFELPRIYINAGARGVLVAMAPTELRRVLSPQLVAVAQPV